jgi:hypothetical protein
MEGTKVNTIPDISPGMVKGKLTVQNAFQAEAPKSLDASTRL